MRPPFAILPLLFVCCLAFSAQALQEVDIPGTFTNAPALVEVRGNLDFPYFVPEVENRANITVGLALSQMSVSAIASGNLTVYVLVQPRRNDSLLYFGGNPGAKSYYLTLNCTVVDGACAPGSVTERPIGVYFKASSSAPLAGDGVVLFASVNPIISEQVNVSEFALNQSAYDQVGELQARIMQAASGIFGLVGQAANATTGALSDISITVTTNNTTSQAALAAVNESSDPLLIAAAQAASDARKSILDGDYEKARELSNKSESLLAQYAAQQDAKKQSTSVSAGVGMFFGALAKPEVAAAILVLALAAFVAFKYKDRLGGKKKGRGCSGGLDFDGL